MEKRWQIRSWRVALSRNCLLNSWDYKTSPKIPHKALECLIKMDVVDDVEQSETYLTTNSAHSSDSRENDSSTEEAQDEGQDVLVSDSNL